MKEPLIVTFDPILQFFPIVDPLMVEFPPTTVPAPKMVPEPMHVVRDSETFRS